MTAEPSYTALKHESVLLSEDTVNSTYPLVNSAQPMVGNSPGRNNTDPEMGVTEHRRSIDDLHLPEDSEQIDIDEDVYGAVIYTVTYDSMELMTGQDYDGLSTNINAYRMFFCLLLLFSNYALQFGLLMIIYMYVAKPSMHTAQKIYQRYHAEVFVHGEFRQEKWDSWDGAYELCNIAFGNYWFMFAILALWWITMAMEARKTQLLYVRLAALGNTRDPLRIITRVDEPEKMNLVLNLTVWMRAILYLILIIPKLVIAVGLLLVGTIWLAATDSFENLVLNSVALSFITNIDEIIFAGLVPFTMKKNINITKLVNISVSAAEGHHVEIVRGYRDSTLWLLGVVVGVAFYLSDYGQNIHGLGIFPGYLADTTGCSEWWFKSRAEICEKGKDCFTIG